MEDIGCFGWIVIVMVGVAVAEILYNIVGYTLVHLLG